MKPFASVITACAIAALLLVDASRAVVVGAPGLPALGVPVPATSGSLAPRLSVGADGVLVLNWLEPAGDGYALRYSTWAPDGWQAPRTVSSGTNWFVNWADFPSVVPIDDTFWVAHWLVRRPAGGYAYDVYTAISNDAGQSWQDGIPLHDDDTDTEHGFVSIFSDADASRAGLVWLDGRNTVKPGAGMTLRTASLSADGTLHNEQQIDELICDCCQTAAVVTRRGPLVAYRDRSVDEIRDIYVAQRLDGKWQPGAAVADDAWHITGCPVNGPALARNGNDVAVAWFTAGSDQPRVRFARGAETGSSFDAPLDIIDGYTIGRVGVVLLDDGTAIVSAIAKQPGGPAGLVLVRVNPDGRRHDPYVVTNEVFPLSVPQLVRYEDKLVVAWTLQAGNNTSVRSAAIPLTALGQSIER